jgi:hypothetical protein
MRFAEYDFLLEVWRSRAPELKLKPIQELVHPKAPEIEAYARDQIKILQNATKHDVTLGGSSVSHENRTTLLNDEIPDLDIRIWINGKDDFGQVETAILGLFPNCQKEDKSDRVEIKKTGVPAYAYVARVSEAGIQYKLEILVRAEGKHGKVPIALGRLKTLTDEQFLQYLNLKAYFKRDTIQYRAFKAAEISFWDGDEQLIVALERIHRGTVGQKLRNSATGAITHSDHMRHVAYRSLALSGNETDFVTGYLHDVSEVGVHEHPPAMIKESIRGHLEGFFESQQISEIIARIEILTEEGLSDEELSVPEPELNQFIEELALSLGEFLKPSQVDYLVGYFRKYQKFLRTLGQEVARIRIVELADRWDGLQDMTYLKKCTVTQQHISFGRVLATLEIMNGDEFSAILNAYEAAYKTFGLNERHIKESARLFLEK